MTGREVAGATLPAEPLARARRELGVLYPPEVAEATYARLVALLDAFQQRYPRPLGVRDRLFDETDVVLITYPDQVREPGRPTLATLTDFLNAHVRGVITGVHLLPHYPSTSDDGFAVADHLAVDPAFGTWEDVERLASHFRLMLDAVVNHTSADSVWRHLWSSGNERYADFFVTVDDGAEPPGVTRPRTSPLLTSIDTIHGPRWVWSTFSPDQLDLNYASPEVLLGMTEVLLTYLEHGAGVLRLDAIAYLWKLIGTSCVHLPETHAVVRLWRAVLEAVAPGVLLITETNVPHAENISYFGDGEDAAHLVYQFPLAPLTLSAFHLADSTLLQEWLATVRTPSQQTAFFNFLGSHDGIGLRPAEGLLTPAEIQHLCELAVAHGGGVSYRTSPDGAVSPYELNTVFFDALNPVDTPEPEGLQVARFLAAQSILLALAGVPAIYVHALLGSRNWIEGVRQTGRLRTINRQKFERAELERELADPSSLRHAVFTGLCARIRARIREPAFHPAGAQQLVATQPAILAFERRPVDGGPGVLCAHNLTGREQCLRAGAADGVTVRGRLVDQLGGGEAIVRPGGDLDLLLPPYGVRWLRET